MRPVIFQFFILRLLMNNFSKSCDDCEPLLSDAFTFALHTTIYTDKKVSEVS